MHHSISIALVEFGIELGWPKKKCAYLGLHERLLRCASVSVLLKHIYSQPLRSSSQYKTHEQHIPYMPQHLAFKCIQANGISFCFVSFRLLLKQPAGYYDINYQTPTSLGASGVRDSNLGSVAYSTMSDGRFTRTDNNSSPVSNVPSTMSQQTGSGGPMINLPYANFAYGAYMMPGSFQYGTPALYPQQLATNASSNAQFAKPSYNSAYGSSGYDGLGQSTQDYNKTAYPGSGTQQSKGQNVSNQPPSGTGSDISSSMYGNKNHAALSKVNVSTHAACSSAILIFSG